MIKISKSQDIPKSLQGVAAPTSSANINERIYKADDVRTQLCNDQHYKCAYCEKLISLEYNDVEHYRPKSSYYWLAYRWDNLLYSCDLCNRTYKKTDFPLASGSVTDWVNQNVDNEIPLIINPSLEDPLNHIWYDGVMMKPIVIDDKEDAKGQETISRFRLNSRDERPDLIAEREVQYEIYMTALSVIDDMNNLLQSPNVSQYVCDIAIAARDKNLMIIQKLRGASSLFSGMIEYYERRRVNL